MPPGRSVPIAFAESSFFPVPPDRDSDPYVACEAQARLGYALICTVGSVAGALLGYAIGALLYETVGQVADQSLRLRRACRSIAPLYAQWGWAVILLKGFTPIPFKIVTITSGLLAYSLPLFVLLCFLTRGRAVFLYRGSSQALRRADQGAAR